MLCVVRGLFRFVDILNFSFFRKHVLIKKYICENPYLVLILEIKVDYTSMGWGDREKVAATSDRGDG